jgi:hypothetical protein
MIHIVPMPKARVPYPVEFRQKIVDLVRSGRSVKELAAEFEPSEQTSAIGSRRPMPTVASARSC